MEQKKIEKIKVDDLVLDNHNPRLPNSLQGEKNEKKIVAYMIAFGNITELMQSIVETGYSDAEPLLVVKDQSINKFVVVEGNRRLTALKLLNDPKIATIKTSIINEIVESAVNSIPKMAPCIVYENRDDILDYLGYRHITGVKDWGALEKANYLDMLYKKHISDSEQDIYKKLSKMIGSKADYVKKLHLAFRLYCRANDELYYGLGISEEELVGKFSWITNSVGYTSVREFLGLSDSSIDLKTLNIDNFILYLKWMFDRNYSVIVESRDISSLAKVMEYPEAIVQLKQGSSLDEAVLYTDEPEIMFISFLSEARNRLKQAKTVIEKLSDQPEETKDILTDIDKLTKTINGALKENFSDSNSSLDDLSEEEIMKLIKKLRNNNQG